MLVIGVSLTLGLTKEMLGNAAFLSSVEQSNRKTPSSRIGSNIMLPDILSLFTAASSDPAIIEYTNLLFLNLLLTQFFLHSRKTTSRPFTRKSDATKD